MRQKSERHQGAAERTIKDIRRRTRKRYSSEEKIRIVLAGLRGEDSIAELCRQEGIAQGLYYSWSKEFLEAGKKRLAGDTARAANSDEVKDLRRESRDLKEVVAEQALELRLLKKSIDRGWGGYRMRYPSSEKLEIIRLVEQSHLPATPRPGLQCSFGWCLDEAERLDAKGQFVDAVKYRVNQLLMALGESVISPG
jgi:transposase-like protein